MPPQNTGLPKNGGIKWNFRKSCGCINGADMAGSRIDISLQALKTFVEAMVDSSPVSANDGQFQQQNMDAYILG